jgi:regulator of sirC expression with transglutaminase-like and TPR domain
VTELQSRRRLGEILAQEGGSFDLAEVALLVAREEYPDLDVPAYVARLDDLGARVHGRFESKEGVAGVVTALNTMLFEEEGFRGNVEEYYDPRNSFLNDVLDRHVGIPISLSTVYMEVARRAGVEVDGVGLPGHFIVRVKGRPADVLVDPFHGGAVLSVTDCQERLDRVHGGRVRLEEAMLRGCEGREIVARMLRNLKAIYTRADDHARTLRTLDLLLAVVDEAEGGAEIRDRALVYEAMDCYALAASDLERYVTRFPGAADETALRRKIQELRRKAARVN